MKRLLFVFLAVWLLAAPALADLIWEPENSFYRQHQNQCEREDRTYWTNGPDGYVTLRESPGGKAVANVENGALIYTEYRCRSGDEDWGLAELRLDQLEGSLLAVERSAAGDSAWLELWFPMEEMLLRYDQQSFREDHSGDILEETRTVPVAGLAFCYYAFPGGECQWQMELKYTEDMEPITVSALYTDEAGREWGYVSYWYGSRNIWFCLSDLENPDLPVEDHTPELYPAAEDGAGTVLPEGAASNGQSAVLAAGAVVLVCGVTAVLLVRMRRKKRA